MELLSVRLKSAAEPTWSDQLSHPFVTGIVDGTLNVERFAFYLRQDYLYLVDYCRLFAICAAKAPDLETMTAFSRLLTDTLEIEMELHRSFSAGFGISLHDLDSTAKAPTTQAYTDFLIATALNGDQLDCLAALLPCAWGYRDVGLHLAAMGPSPDDRYQRWIEMYAGPEYGQMVDWCIDLLDRLGSGVTEATYSRLASIFITSTRYEARFWEMAWTMEQW